MLASSEERSSQKDLKSYKVGGKTEACLRRLDAGEIGIVKVKAYRQESQF